MSTRSELQSKLQSKLRNEFQNELRRKPNGELWIGFYGDDLTGSTDAMDSLSTSGVRTALFLRTPEPRDLDAFPGVQAIGIAGLTRTMRPAEIEEELRPAFAFMREIKPRVVHYKVCSTFDSSPEIGSIGKAVDVGREVFDPDRIPLLVTMSKLGRYTVFGNLFARSGGDPTVHRLDRHPTMPHHPITPMRESDLRLHLGLQTRNRIVSFDLLQLEGSFADVRRRWDEAGFQHGDVVVLDAVTDAHLALHGRLMWELSAERAPLFVVGSSGVGYALVAHWQAEGMLANGVGPASEPAWEPIREKGPIVVASGSCSPVTSRQIQHALEHGFVEIALEPQTLLSGDRAAQDEVASRAAAHVRAGQSVIIHSAKSPEDVLSAEALGAFLAPGADEATARIEGGKRMGSALGRILRRVLTETGVRRAVVAGGDTSSYVARALEITALEMIAPLAPGAPLCRAYAPGSPLHRMEIVFKGGQIGAVDVFVSARGQSPR